ncbi:MAG: hypothetical protein ACRDNG_08015 [Gaiellaceae bacterium]
MRLRGPSDRWILGCALAAFTVVAGLESLSGLSTRDEAWFLQVVARVASGDVLYRDIFFGATPLSVWVTLPFVALVGVQLALVKLVVVGAFAATLLLVVWTARLLGAGTLTGVVLAAAMLVFAPLPRVGLYQPLATVFLLACLAAALAWQVRLGEREPDPRRERWLILAAGAAAGLAFSSKQNIGLYALAALLGAVVLGAAGQRLRSSVVALGGFAACALLPLVPVAITGGLDRFAEYGLSNKGTYVERGGVSYFRGLLGSIGNARDRATAGEGWRDAVYSVLPAQQVLLFLLVPTVLVLLAFVWLRSAGAERRRAGVVGLFLLAAVAALYPLADGAHVRFVAPVILLAAWFALDGLAGGISGRGRRLAAIAIAVVLVPGAAVRTAWPVLRVVDQDARPSTLPHARWILIEPERELLIRRTGRSLARQATRGTVFLATPEAGFYYLESGVDNSTPYDYPLVTAFGRTGEAELAAEIERGEVDAVCMRYHVRPERIPWQLVAAVQTSMDGRRYLPACRIYRWPALGP